MSQGEWNGAQGCAHIRKKTEQVDRGQIVLATQGAFYPAVSCSCNKPSPELLTSNGRTRARLRSIYALNTDQQ